MKKAIVIIQNEEGLHARPASVFSNAAMKFKCDILMLKNMDENKVYNPKSILSVLSMGAKKGDELTIIADGTDEEEAIDKINKIISNGLVEGDQK